MSERHSARSNAVVPPNSQVRVPTVRPNSMGINVTPGPLRRPTPIEQLANGLWLSSWGRTYSNPTHGKGFRAGTTLYGLLMRSVCAGRSTRARTNSSGGERSNQYSGTGVGGTTSRFCFGCVPFMRRIVLSLWVWFAIGVLLVLWLPVMGVAWLVDRDPALYNAGFTLRIVGRLLTYVNPFWDIHLEGPFPEDPRNPYVVVGNHFSQADPPIIARVPWEMKWVAKKALFDLPVAGWLLRMSGDISVDRTDKRSRARVLETARSYLERKCSVMFFPEGTRSRDGRVHRFSDGSFRLAIKQGVPVLPIAIDGTHEALPKHSIWFNLDVEQIRVKVLPPVQTSAYSPGQARELQRYVRARIVRQIATWRGVDPAAVDAMSNTGAAASEWLDAPPTEPAVVDDGEASVKPSTHSDSSEPGG